MPDDVRSRLTLVPGDRVIAEAELTDGWAAASVGRLHVVAGANPPASRPWADVDAARLDPETSELTVTWVDGGAPLVLHLADDQATAFPRALHERVQSSVVHTERVTLAGGAVVRVALRRDADGGLLTQVLGTGRIDMTDPATASAIDAAEARVRESAGLS